MSEQIQTRSSGRQTYIDLVAHFTKQAPRYDRGCDKVEWKGHMVVFDALRKHIDVTRQLKVLDIGTGTGKLGALFKENHGNPQTHVTGVDITPDMIAIARTRIDDARIGDASDLSWSHERAFNVVASSGVFDFIPVQEIDSVASGIARVTQPGGLVSFTYEPEGTKHDGSFTLQHSTLKLNEAFANHGIAVVEIEAVDRIYNNFRTKKPVENLVWVGRRLEH